MVVKVFGREPDEQAPHAAFDGAVAQVSPWTLLLAVLVATACKALIRALLGDAEKIRLLESLVFCGVLDRRSASGDAVELLDA